MKISLPHKYWPRLLAGIMAMAFSLGSGFSMAAPAASMSFQAENTSQGSQDSQDSGTQTPTTPETPRPPPQRPTK